MPAQPSRRGVLRALGAVALGAMAGCTTGTRPPADRRTGSPEGPTAGRRTQSPTELPDRTVAFPDGPKERPSRPATLTASTAREYVQTFEYRYVYNQLWLGPSTVVHLDCWVEAVGDVGVGYRVRVTCTGWSESAEVHADYFTQAYVYHLDEDSLVRRYAGTGTPTPNSPTPRRGG